MMPTDPHGHGLFVKPPGVRTRWASFENPLGLKGAGARENRGAKGHSADCVGPGQTVMLMRADGPGVVRRIWMTILDRSPLMLRGMRIDAYWDGADRPAVSAPLGDFFGVSLGRRVPFDSELFSDPEGRSFVCHVPMPFRAGARITLTNETDTRQPYLFYDVNYELHDRPGDDWLYLHAHWRRERPTTLGRDYAILPTVRGAGRFLGVTCGVLADKRYNSWWGEGEVKVYLDGDSGHPTLAGTGTEDYVGDAWGLKAFSQRYAGCPVCDDAAGAYSFYRWHVPDPVWFHADCRVTIQQIGATGAGEKLRGLVESDLPHQLTLWDRLGVGGTVHRLLDDSGMLEQARTAPDGGVHYYRVDDYSSCGYVYLDRPTNDLPALAPLPERIAGLVGEGGGSDRADL